MYWCNCVEGWKAKGRKLCRSSRTCGIGAFQKTEINKDETCVHCGYAAFFSKTDPNNLDHTEQR